MYHHEEGHWWYVGMRAISEALLPPGGLPDSPRALDGGCGTGYNLLWLRRVYGASPVGIDFYPYGLPFCRRRGERALAQGSIAELPFASETFDLVTSFDVVSHVPTGEGRRRALEEFFRVLRPGGTLLVRMAAFEWLRTSHDNENLTYHRFSRRELRSGLAAAGFHGIRTTFANAFLFPAAIGWRLLKRAAIAPAGSDVSDATRGPDWVNAVLAGFLRLEARLLGAGFRLPVGLSVFGSARKPPSGGNAP